MLEVDMHVHSHYSDGSDSPREIIRKAKLRGLKAVCLTDHDNVDGLAEFENSLAEYKFDGLAGLEISSIYEGHIVHILGYGLDYSDSKKIQTLLQANQQALNHKIEKALESYKQAQIADINLVEMNKLVGCKSTLGFILWLRDYRVRFCGATPTQAKQETLRGGIAHTSYDKKKLMTPARAVRTVKELGGFAVWAHPGQFMNRVSETQLRNHIEELLATGIKGLEIFHPTNTKVQQEFLTTLARYYKLILTGGSDYHGRHKMNQLGEAGIDYQSFLQIKKNLR